MRNRLRNPFLRFLGAMLGEPLLDPVSKTILPKRLPNNIAPKHQITRGNYKRVTCVIIDDLDDTNKDPAQTRIVIESKIKTVGVVLNCVVKVGGAHLRVHLLVAQHMVRLREDAGGLRDLRQQVHLQVGTTHPQLAPIVSLHFRRYTDCHMHNNTHWYMYESKGGKHVQTVM